MSSFPPNPPDSGHNFTKTIHHDTYPAIDPATQSDHTGHYVFITGASKGVGRATALSFAKAGAAGIAIAARSGFDNLSAEILSAAKAAGKPAPRVLEIKLDVMTYSDVEDAAKVTEKEFGKLDVLINNAGFLSEFEPIKDSDPEDYWRNYEVNVRGVYWVTKAFLPLILKGGEKTIVNLSSVGAHLITHGGSAYQASKFVLLRFTEHLLVEHAGEGLVAFCVHPGGVPTGLSSKLPPHIYKRLADTPEIGADTMCFLTAQRRPWLNGRYISCSWDIPELLSREEEIVKEDKLLYRMKF